jgi:hypothetical protein
MSFTFVTAPQITDTFQANGKKRRKPMSPEALKARGVKISQTKLAKRKVHNKICPRCQKPFVANRKGKMCCSEECARLLQSQRLKANGHRPQKFVNTENWLAAVKSKENREKISKSLTGTIRTTPKSQRFSPEHSRARTFFIRSPDGKIWHVQNITRFVHENPGLFDPNTVIWTSRKSKASIRCHASHGLAMVGRGFRLSWRGWTWVSSQDAHSKINLQREI